MSDKKVWFITGGGRGMGVDIAKAALAAGNAVVATARDPEAVTKSIGAAADLLAARLTSPAGRRGSRGSGRGRTLRQYRRPSQQRRQLQRRLLRGADG